MLATCVPTFESYMYGKKRFHSMHFALDYKVKLFVISFSCLAFK